MYMKIIVNLSLLLCLGCFPLMGMPEKNYSSEWNQNEIDSVCFYYYPIINGEIDIFDFKFHKDTLFVFKPACYYEKRDYDYNILCQKIINQDTVNFIKEFVQLFITDKKENIILKEVEEPESLYWNHTSIIIRTYINGGLIYNERIVLYPEEEYNPKFLHLCDLLLSIAKENK